MSDIKRGEINRRYDHQFQLRLPKSLFKRVAACAKSREQAINSEIVAALAVCYPAPIEEEVLNVNEALVEASEALLDDWCRTLNALGQDPKTNPRVVVLSAAIYRANSEKGGAK